MSDKEWGVHLDTGGERDYDNLPPSIKEDIMDELESLADDPHRGEKKKGDLKEVRGFKPDVDREEDYRIAYTHTMKNGHPYCSVIGIGTREGFYDDLKNRV